MESLEVEKFYVYRSLNNDESWGCILLDGSAENLPNIDFGMKVFARNEKEAITRAKREYDKIHSHDSDKENIRRFIASSLKALISSAHMEPDAAADRALEYAISMNNRYKKYIERIDNVEALGDNEGNPW